MKTLRVLDARIGRFKWHKTTPYKRPLSRDELRSAHLRGVMALCLLATLQAVARARASGLTPRQIIDKFKTLKMVDVILSTTNGRTITLPHHIEPHEDTAFLLAQLDLPLPAPPPPKVSHSLSPRMYTVM